MASGHGSEDPASFAASQLGCKEHWDKVYDGEMANFKSSGEIGEIWFGEDVAMKMVDWVCDNISDTNARILDVGCGNGHLLMELASNGYTNLTGTDYSPQAIELARNVNGGADSNHGIQFEVQDFLDAQDIARVAGSDRFDVVLDKGTYDAICLKPQDAAGGPAVDQAAISIYPRSVAASLKDTGVFLITSCNWTEDELVERFRDQLVCVGKVKHPSFRFGGAVGQTVTTLAFGKPRDLTLSAFGMSPAT
ncbi:Protein-lysine N-methyltransferase efm4 [Coemansia biformis]|uniref:Protein-lysine N-methyltransferase EFM4 n=1 Tax=Coemansia biformis TaxID=1286918 RepID=A0A9W7YB54_9FUNG|nr:Protein-lysine N-methyltransferase efm4 [Coemansia biformis]